MSFSPNSRNIRALNRNVVCRQRVKRSPKKVKFNGRDVQTDGIVLPSGLIAPTQVADIKCNGAGHEMEVMSSVIPDIPKGSKVIINASEIGHFINDEVVTIPESDVWAVVEERDGRSGLRIRGKHVLLTPNLSVMKWLAGIDQILVPFSVFHFGISVSGSDNPTDGGSRAADSVTARAGRVVAKGPDVPDAILGDLQEGEMVAYCPSYCCTTIAFNGAVFDVAPADELLFAVDEIEVSKAERRDHEARRGTSSRLALAR
jgi:co-chaperonin GroES (HSP10)